MLSLRTVLDYYPCPDAPYSYRSAMHHVRDYLILSLALRSKRPMLCSLAHGPAYAPTYSSRLLYTYIPGMVPGISSSTWYHTRYGFAGTWHHLILVRFPHRVPFRFFVRPQQHCRLSSSSSSQQSASWHRPGSCADPTHRCADAGRQHHAPLDKQNVCLTVGTWYA